MIQICSFVNNMILIIISENISNFQYHANKHKRVGKLTSAWLNFFKQHYKHFFSYLFFNWTKSYQMKSKHAALYQFQLCILCRRSNIWITCGVVFFLSKLYFVPYLWGTYVEFKIWDETFSWPNSCVLLYILSTIWCFVHVNIIEIINYLFDKYIYRYRHM